MMKLDDSRIGVIELLEDNRWFLFREWFELDLCYSTDMITQPLNHIMGMEENKITICIKE